MITLCKREMRKLPQKTGGLGIGFGHEKDADHICGQKEGFRKKSEKSVVFCQTSLGTYQFTFAQNRPKSNISGAMGPIHYITLKAFAMALGDRTM